MSWASNWQQDLTPVDRDVSNTNVYKSEADPVLTKVEEPLTNLTLEYCIRIYENLTNDLLRTNPREFCEVSFDGLSCWPPTLHNHSAVQSCFSELDYVKYDSTQNVSKHCFNNGTWSKVNYFEVCKPIIPEESNIHYYFFGGYILSLVTLLLAITIFTYFKELRCLRNKIHLNFMWAQLSNHIMWILTYILLFNLQLLYGSGDTPFLCFVDVILLQYSYITTFFWMLVEGLYLYIMVVKTLTYENFTLKTYVIIGWGLPVVITIIWAIARGIVHSISETSTCQWFHKYNIDMILQVPVAIIVFLNFVFLVSIMCVLVTKLRSASRVEAQQYYKAAKALLVLNPLLGTTYVFTFYAPTLDASGAYIFECVRAILLSTQGFIVALFYCFRNTEVKNTLRHHFDNWKASRTLSHSRMRTTSRSKDTRRNTEWTLVHTDETDIDVKFNSPRHMACNGIH